MDRENDGRVTQNISLTAIEALALDWLARRRYQLPTDEPLKRGVISWTVKELIDQRMRSEIGRDWEVVIVTEATDRTGVAA